MGMSCVAFLLLASGSRQTATHLDPTFGLPIPKRHAKNAKKAIDADWIWTATTTDTEVAYFRHGLTLAKLPKKAKLSVTADNFFNAYVNGQEVGSSHPSDSDALVWAKVQTYDVTSLLKVGANEFGVKGTNAGGVAGVIFRLEIDGKPVLLSDDSWKVTDTTPSEAWAGTAFDDSGWQKPVTEAKAGEGVWGTQLTGWPVQLDSDVDYLAHLKMSPVSISMSGPGTSWTPSGETLNLTRPSDGGKPWTVLVDFGKELSGRVAVSSPDSIAVRVGTGESDYEAYEKPYKTADLDLKTTPGFTPYTALRYAAITFPASQASAKIQVYMDHDYYPVQYLGSFDCSDPLFTKVWYTGAYTAHLCMQEDIWDAPKRDRARWMGDLHVSGEVINNVFLDKFLMEQTMDRLRADDQGGHPATELPGGNVNGIPGYTCAWIAGVADFYRHVGDAEWLKKQHQPLVTMLAYMHDELGDDGLFASKHKQWAYVDWAPLFNGQTPQSLATTHLFYVKAANEAAFIFHALGDSENEAKAKAWANELTSVAQAKLVSDAGTFGDRRQENAMAIYSGVATASQVSTIYEKVLAPNTPAWGYVATPYYNNYVLDAITQSGHMDDAMKFVRTYWGGMLAQGATSWWEGYDNTWEKDNFHSHLQADDGTGYFVSLCHGWSAGPTNWLTERVLGVKSTGGGFKTCEINPNLGDLKWASGTVPTPNGPIKLRVENVGGKYKVNVTIPKGVEATLGSQKLKVGSQSVEVKAP